MLLAYCRRLLLWRQARSWPATTTNGAQTNFCRSKLLPTNFLCQLKFDIKFFSNIMATWPNKSYCLNYQPPNHKALAQITTTKHFFNKSLDLAKMLRTIYGPQIYFYLLLQVFSHILKMFWASIWHMRSIVAQPLIFL